MRKRLINYTYFIESVRNFEPYNVDNSLKIKDSPSIYRWTCTLSTIFVYIVSKNEFSLKYKNFDRVGVSGLYWFV